MFELLLLIAGTGTGLDRVKEPPASIHLPWCPVAYAFEECVIWQYGRWEVCVMMVAPNGAVDLLRCRRYRKEQYE
jgi:hypothetical protein